MSEEYIKCPICGNKNSPDLEECKICGSTLDLMEEEEKSILNALQNISGVGHSRAKNIVKSGMSDFDKLEDAELENFLSVEGVGEETAKEIMETIEGSRKEDGELFLCGDCGAFVGEHAKRCSNCGAKMVDEEEETEEGEAVEEEEMEDRGEEDESLYLCDNCGSFISSSADKCPYCGSKLEMGDVDEETDLEGEIEKELEGSLMEEGSEEDEGLYLCTNCGSFVSAESDRCTQCGFHFDEAETGTAEETEERPEDFEKGPEDTEERMEETEIEEPVDIEDAIEPEEEEISDEDIFEVEGVPEGIEDAIEPEEEEISDEDIFEVEGVPEGIEDAIEPEEEEITDEDIFEVEGELEDIESGEDTSQDISMPEGELWDSEDLEIDESDIQELDREIDMALEEEYGISSSTIRSLSLGGDVKICGNCGRICESKLSDCPVCGFKFKDISEPVSEEEEWDKKGSEETLRKALGIEEIPDEMGDIDEKEGEAPDICSICGAFFSEGAERCPICGSLTSETPDLEVDEEETPSREEEKELYLCDACGAFVGKYQSSCPVCGSDLKLARREVKEEEIEESIDHTDEVLEAFFGSTDNIELKEDIEDKKIGFCDVCGALIVEGADRCSICLSTIEEVKGEAELEGFEYFFGVDEVSEDELEGLEEDIEDELSIDLDQEGGPGEEEIGVTDEEFRESSDELDLMEEEIEDVDDDALEELIQSWPEDEDIPDSMLDEIDKELQDEIEEDLRAEGFEEEKVEDSSESGISDEELREIVGDGESGSSIDERTEEVEDEVGVDQVLDEISEKAKGRMDEEPKFKEERGDEGDEWRRCPSCDSYVSVESDTCGVCDYSFVEDRMMVEEKKVTGVERELDSKSEISTSGEGIEEDTGWIEEVMEKSEEKQSVLTDRDSKQSPTGVLQQTISRIKEYEVPVSSLSLLTFGGLYLYSYQRSTFSSFIEVGLGILGIFLALGLITLFVLKEQYLPESKYGLIGYFGALAIASFIPIRQCILGLGMPFIIDVGLIGTALGLFWILDFTISKGYRYYMMWFAGIALLFIVIVALKFSSISGLMNFSYPVLMSLGLGTVLVVGSTTNWYIQARNEEETYEDVKTGYEHLVRGDNQSAIKSFNKAIENGNEGSQMISGAEDGTKFPHYSKGLAMCSMGRYKEAIEAFKRVIEISPESVPAWNNLGTAYSRMGDQKTAIKCFKRALNVDPEYELSWNNLGNALFRKGDYSKALDCYDKALDINGSYRDAVMNKSQALAKLGKSETPA